MAHDHSSSHHGLGVSLIVSVSALRNTRCHRDRHRDTSAWHSASSQLPHCHTTMLPSISCISTCMGSWVGRWRGDRGTRLALIGHLKSSGLSPDHTGERGSDGRTGLGIKAGMWATGYWPKFRHCTSLRVCFVLGVLLSFNDFCGSFEQVLNERPVD